MSSSLVALAAQMGQHVDADADLLAVGDFDGDGNPERALASLARPEVRIARSAEIQCALCGHVALPALPLGLTSGDFDGDDRADLAVALVDQRLALYLGLDDLNFKLAGITALRAPATDLESLAVEGHPREVIVTAGGGTLNYIDPDLVSEPADASLSQAVQAAAVDHHAAFAQVHAMPGLAAQPGLTRREQDVVDLALLGLTARVIGARLFIGERTVESHLARAYGKLGVSSRFEMLLKSRDG